MPRADYGIYGSLAFFAILAIVTSLSLALTVFTVSSQDLFLGIFAVSAMLLAASLTAMIYISRRTGIVPKVLKATKITPDVQVLDVGTGRGFLAIEIAKAVKGCRIVGIDLWDKPAKGQMHKGFVIGNSKENAERNAVLEGVADRVEFIQCDAREMPFESESFDIVVSCATLHQIFQLGKGDESVLGEIGRVLKHGGRLVNVDFMIGQRMIEKLQQLGFTDIEITETKPRSLSFYPKMLSTTKG